MGGVNTMDLEQPIGKVGYLSIIKIYAYLSKQGTLNDIAAVLLETDRCGGFGRRGRWGANDNRY